jgi:flavodoxin
MSKTLIVYFSRTGEQYSVGNITKGNTAIVAEIIAEKTDGDLFEIKVVNDNYPNEYTPLIQFAKKEKQENARPEIIGDVNIDNYDTVFIGYPNWWAEMPMPVYTFLEKYNLSSKKVYKFCTHEGSGGVHTDDFALYGLIAQNERPQAEKKVSEWLKNIAY